MFKRATGRLPGKERNPWDGLPSPWQIGHEGQSVLLDVHSDKSHGTPLIAITFGESVLGVLLKVVQYRLPPITLQVDRVFVFGIERLSNGCGIFLTFKSYLNFSSVGH